MGPSIRYMGSKNFLQHYSAHCWDFWNRCGGVTQLHNAKCNGRYAHPSTVGIALIIIISAVWSIGVGGNLPVDSSIFLEFLPASHGYLLTVLSIW